MLIIWTYYRRATAKNAARIYACSKDANLWIEATNRNMYSPERHALIAKQLAYGYGQYSSPGHVQDIYAINTKKGFLFTVLPSNMRPIDKSLFTLCKWEGIKCE